MWRVECGVVVILKLLTLSGFTDLAYLAQSSKLLLPKATGLQALSFELIALSYTTTTLSELILNI